MGLWKTTVLVPGPREVVFDLFADRENYRRLVAPLGARLVREGVVARQGPGAVHRVGLAVPGLDRVGLSEQITAIVPGRRIEYRAVTPLPVRHYIGVIEFDDHTRGTSIDYSLDVEAPFPLPGPAMWLLVRSLAGGLARGATRELRRQE